MTARSDTAQRAECGLTHAEIRERREGVMPMTNSILSLLEAKDSLVKASTPEPWSSSKTSNWV